jgi:peptidoglycan/xylan/chitin deacetylase (PgdA/CDA1 family)
MTNTQIVTQLVFGIALTAGLALSQKSLPVWEWDFPRIERTVNKIRAGRDLTPKTWPGGARVAVALSFDVDTEETGLAWEQDMASQYEYAARVGVPRILKLLERYSIPVTFFIPAVGAQLHPEEVDAILRSPLRHEIGVHGWVHEQIPKLSPEQERRLTRQAFEFWTKRLGHKPVGIRTPSWTYSATTLSIIQELGFLYDSSLMSDDRPYEILADHKSTGIIEVPVEGITDDYVYYQGLKSADSAVLATYEAEFDMAYDEGTLFQLTMHPLVTGHRSRLAALDQLLAHMKSKPGVWFATHEQVAQVAKAQMR